MNESRRFVVLAWAIAAVAPMATAEAQNTSTKSAWVTTIKTKAVISTPIAAAIPADLTYTLKIGSPDPQGQSSAEIGALAIGVPEFQFDPTKMIQYLKGSVTLPNFTPVNPSTVPVIVIPVGVDANGKQTDIDNDKKYGVTMIASALGLLQMDVYVGIKFSIALQAKLQDANTLTGDSTFGVSGDIYGSNFLLLGPGKIDVKQASSVHPFTATRIDDGLTCAQVVAQQGKSRN